MFSEDIDCYEKLSKKPKKIGKSQEYEFYERELHQIRSGDVIKINKNSEPKRVIDVIVNVMRNDDKIRLRLLTFDNIDSFLDGDKHLNVLKKIDLY